MLCKNCGNEIIEEFGTCPYCKTQINSNKNDIISYRENRTYNGYRNNQNYNSYKKNSVGNIIATIGIILGGAIFISSTTSLSKNWNQYGSYKPNYTIERSTYAVPSTTITDNQKSTNYSNPTITLKNYQQIYNEYSQKLISSGPTSSMNEMANITNEGVLKMAQYMRSASGTDGQYTTYESWATKLYEVYMNNVR